MNTLEKYRENQESQEKKELTKKQHLTFVAQPFHSMQCGQACLAMITGKSIEKICNELGKHWSTSIDSDMMPYLTNLGFKTRLVKGSDIDFTEVPNNSIIRIAYPNEKGHFIIKNNDKFYDPSIGVLTQILANRKITHYLTYK